MGIKKIIGVAAVLLSITMFVPTPAHANVILPVFIVLPLTLLSWPTLLLAALMLITVAESIVLSWVLGLSIWYSVWVVFVANLVSTAFGFFGIPIWGIVLLLYPVSVLLFILNAEFFLSNKELLFIIVTVGLMWTGAQIINFANPDSRYNTRWKRVVAVTLFAPFLLVGEDAGWEDWMAPAVILSLLIPCFFASWYIESLVVDSILQWYGFSIGLVEHALLVANLVSYGVMALVVALWLVMELWGITWGDLLSAKRKFAARLYGYKIVSEKPSLPRISKTYEPVKWDMGRGMDALVEAEARVAMNLKSSSEEQLKKQEKVKSGNESAEGSKENAWAA
jgi:hypothetical protein